MDFNRANLSASNVNSAINALLDKAALDAPKVERDYLGASLVGEWCLRKIQYTWKCESTFLARIKRILARGHMFEEMSAQAFASAGFRMQRGDSPVTSFEEVNGSFRGHADGVIVAGPHVEGMGYPCLWEHKALGDIGWKSIEKKGLREAYPQYYGQVQLYQAYLGVDANPALFTAVNANTCEMLHVLVPFDAETAQAVSDRAVAVIKATQAGELLDRGTDNPSDWRCKMCSHKERCWK